jgi:hypothetical protein
VGLRSSGERARADGADVIGGIPRASGRRTVSCTDSSRHRAGEYDLASRADAAAPYSPTDRGITSVRVIWDATARSDC